MPDLLPVLTACCPRPREQTSQNYAADLHQSLNGEIKTPADAVQFFAGTYATDAMRRVTAGIFARLGSGAASDAPAVIRFNSAFGGGKTHTLIALAAAARHPQLVRAGKTGGLMTPNLAVDGVKLVCFTGENADVLRGMALDGTDRRAKSLTGFLAYHLGGAPAYDAIKQYDDRFTDPGAEGFQQLIGNRPTLILVDELVRWVAAAKQLDGDLRRAGDGLRNGLTAIAKAVSNSPRAVLVITAPEPGHDAYRDETQQVYDVMGDVDSVISRTARDYTPTETGDFPAILRRRLFANAEDSPQRDAVAEAYAAVWHRQNPSDTGARQRFYDCYPFHPETLRVITERLASNNDFQRVRGTLRAAAAVIHHHAEHGPEIAEPLIHPYHLDVAIPAVREELVHRTGHSALDAAILSDVTGDSATAQRFGSLTRRAANIILLGSLAPTANNGLADTEIVNGLISPAASDYSVAMQAVRNMKDYGLYIDDDPDAGATRFNRQANVRREVEQRASAVSEDDREDSIIKAIGEAFASRDGMLVTVFPSRTNNVPDDPNLAHIGILNPNHITVRSGDLGVELGGLYAHNAGNGGNALREYRNNALFLVADNADLADIKQQIARHKAASEMLQIDRREPRLLEYQRETLEGIRQSSRKAVYQGIQRNWVNLYYPEPGAPHGLQHARLRFPDQEGRGQDTIVDFLTGDAIQKMAHPRNPALGPNIWADAGLRRAAAGGMSVGELHDRFTRTPGRKMFLMRAHFDRALDTANSEGDRQIIVIRTPQGLEIRGGSGVAYREDMRVWLKEHAPQPDAPEPPSESEPEPLPPQPAPAPGTSYIPPFTSQEATGQVAVAELQTRMSSGGLDWGDIASAALYGAQIGLLNDLASKAQANDVGAVISYFFDANGFELRAAGKTAAEWQQCRRACEQMQRAAGARAVDAQVSIDAADNAADAIRTILHDLDNTHQVTLAVQFRQPNA